MILDYNSLNLIGSFDSLLYVCNFYGVQSWETPKLYTFVLDIPQQSSLSAISNEVISLS